MNKLHNLKIAPTYFADVLCGAKTFEIRKDDRDFAVGDSLCLEEWVVDVGGPDAGHHTGRFIVAKVPYIIRDSQYVKPGYCVLSLHINRTWGVPV
jgi:hypothetical protein